MYNGFWGRDRRRFQRLKVNLDVCFRVESPIALRGMLGDRRIEAILLDIGQGGMALLSPHNIPPEAELVLEFSLFKTDRMGLVSFSDPIEISGEVRSSILIENGQYRLGISFKALRCGQGNEITDFVAASLRQ
jgi:c-di-GMP-binding flagellar brake protein YcgR